MDEDPILKSSITTARILHIAFILALLVFMVILYVTLSDASYVPVFAPGDPEMDIVATTLGVASVMSIATGFLLPRWVLKRFRDKARGLLTIHIITSAFFEAVGIYGLILGIMGAGAQIAGLFLLVSLAALILSFPRSEKWKRIMEDSNSLS